MMKKRCEICQRYRADIPIDEKRYICLECDLGYLYGASDKATIIDTAFELVRKEKLSLRQALKVACGHLSLEIEKDKNIMKRRKKRQQSVDICLLGKRRAGHYNG